MGEIQAAQTEGQIKGPEVKGENLPKKPDSIEKLAVELPKIKKAEGADKQKDEEVQKKLPYMDNNEFLKIRKEDRLAYITKPEKDYNKVIEGDKLTFTFSPLKDEGNELSKELNRNLERKTTAGQVLPPSVKEIKIGEEIYTRESIGGEFFTPDNKRLLIFDGTTIQIGKTRTKDEIGKISEENQKKTEEYLKSNPDSDSKIVSEAIIRGIDPKIAGAAFGELVKNTPKEKISQVLEDAFTEYDRMRDYNNVSSKENTGKNFITLILDLLMKFTSGNWKEVAKSKLNIDDNALNSHENISASNNERASKIKSFNNLDENKGFKENAIAISKEIEKVYGIPWKITVSQAALESNWGKSKLSTEGNNYFGIKSFGKGPSVNFNTQEVVNGKTVTVNDGFKAFGDMKDSFIGYANFLTKNQRYRNAFNFGADINPKPEYYSSNYQGYDPEKFAGEIAKAGYATDPNYYQKIVSISRGLNDNVA